MKVIRVLSIVGLAIYLILQGLFYVGMQQSPTLNFFVGIIGLLTGILMFISLSHWIDYYTKEK